MWNCGLHFCPERPNRTCLGRFFSMSRYYSVQRDDTEDIYESKDWCDDSPSMLSRKVRLYMYMLRAIHQTTFA
jgi:hypothetical protein